LDGIIGAFVTAALASAGYGIKRWLDVRAARGQSEVAEARSFHEAAYRLKTEADGAIKRVDGRASLTDDQRAALIERLRSLANDTVVKWDGAYGLFDSTELKYAAVAVDIAVKQTVLEPSHHDDLPSDITPLREALAAFREVANRRINARL